MLFFTHPKDKKLLRIQLGAENYYGKKVIIDEPDSEIAASFTFYTPKIYQIKNNEILESFDFDETILERCCVH